MLFFFPQFLFPQNPKKKFLETRNFSEASTRFELVIEVLQTFALPLGYDAIFYYMSDKKQKLLSVK